MKLLLNIILFIWAASHNDPVTADCKCRDIILYGNVKIVTAGEDLKVRIVEAGEDLRVLSTDIANSCGKWHFVETGEDFKIRFVGAGEDFTIAFSSVPGVAP
jgi:hypothetical protein